MRRLLQLCLPPLLLAGCQTAPPPTLTPACMIAARPKEHVDTLRIALPEPVAPSGAAVAGTSEVERFLFLQFYETLVRRDCAGVVLPGLAASWDMSRDSTWIFQLRPDIRFSDGSRVTAADVVTILKAAAPAGWRVTTSGSHVAVHAPRDLLPGALSDRHYAIAKAGGGGWPLSTMGTVSPIPDGVMFTREARGVTLFTWPAGADARDLLERGTDAVVTSQQAALDFANVRGNIDAIPLPWSSTYVLAVPTGQTTAFAQGGRSWRDAVSGDARAAAGPFWWANTQCSGAPAPPAQAAPPARVVYPQGDGVARALAERLVARGVPRAEPLAPAELRAALAGGADHVLVTVPARAPADPCGVLSAAGLAGRAATTLLALVDTRYQLIVRSGRFGVLLDGTGTPRIQQ